MSVPSQMKCLVKETEKEGYDLVTRPVPKAGPGDVIIKIDKVGHLVLLLVIGFKGEGERMR